jgi:hypothetical protein
MKGVNMARRPLAARSDAISNCRWSKYQTRAEALANLGISVNLGKRKRNRTSVSETLRRSA